MLRWRALFWADWPCPWRSLYFWCPPHTFWFMEKKNSVLRNPLRSKLLAAALLLFGVKPSSAQQPPKLTLQEAEMMALQNHPQIQAAQNEAQYANQQITIARSPYYPLVNADMTGS